MAKVVISLRLEADQLARWRESATSAGLTLTDYITLRVDGAPAPAVPVPPPPAPPAPAKPKRVGTTRARR